MDSVPMVAITGQVGTSFLGTDAFQEADIVGITRSITKHNFLVKTTAELPMVLKQAFHIASTGRPGPVLVDIPRDVLTGFIDNYEYPESVEIRGYKPNMVGHIRQIRRAAEAIANARKPVIFAGGGVIISGAGDELLALAEKINTPVTTTLMGLGGFPGNHPLFIGMPGMHGAKVANYALQETDLIISVGARFDDRVTGHVGLFAPNASVIHMDIDPAAISKIIKVDIPVVGDAKNILGQLLAEVKPRPAGEWNAKVAEWKGKKLFDYEPSDKVIKPQAVIEELYHQTGGNAVVATEVGQHQMWTAHYYVFSKPRSILTSGGLGTMGYGMPAAMGAAMVIKDRPVVDIAGDGSIQMNIQELATISINRIPVKVIILNNSYLGMVRQWQELFFNRRYSSTCLRGSSVCDNCPGPESCDKTYIPDFVALAKSYGIEAFRAEHPSQVAEVLRRGLAVDGPAIMEFRVSPEENVYPMVPSGKAIDDILEG
jgi:acetolactate synthase-1/2/3 large subunit